MENKKLTEQYIRMSGLLFKNRMGRGHSPVVETSPEPEKRLLGMIKLRELVSENDLIRVISRGMKKPEEMIKKLEEQGYITRTPQADNPKIVVINLTEKGRQEAQDFPAFDDPFTCLNDEERKNLEGYFSRIIEALEKKSGDAPGGFNEWEYPGRHFFGGCRGGFFRRDFERPIPGSSGRMGF